MVLIELGSVAVGLAVLARIASRFAFSPIPLYLLAGLALGTGGVFPLELSRGFIELGAELGVLLLLFLLGLEHTGEELRQGLRTGLPAGLADLLLNFAPGLLAGLLLQWPLPVAIVLGGITYISSSGIAARLIHDLGRSEHPEMPLLLAILTQEDLAMAVFLPVLAALLLGGSMSHMAISVAIAVATVAAILFAALRFGRPISAFAAHQSDEVILLTTFGAVLLVSGIAQRLQVSAAIGAFLTGIALSGPIAAQSRRLMAPLRDLLAAAFFFFFGLRIAPVSLPPLLLFALLLAAVTAATKLATAIWAAPRFALDRDAGFRAGAILVPRGEFSIVLAQLGSSWEPRLEPLTAAYVLILAVLGPFLARLHSAPFAHSRVSSKPRSGMLQCKVSEPWPFSRKICSTSSQTLSWPRSKNTRIDGPAPLNAQPSSPGARNRRISCSPGTSASR
jgi:CPA2 family monovalent cation:H+ antiporter-2